MATQWIEGFDRQQVQWLPAQVEDYVHRDNPVRFLDTFVDGQDLAGKGIQFPKAPAQGKGRPGYHPGDLLKLYLYGYLNGIRSSRKLEAQCRHNLEVIWLLRGLRPDFKTIADFRKDNAAAFKAINREFTLLCQRLDLFGAEFLAIDGTKIKGQNARDQNWSQSKLQKQLETAQQRLEKYLKDLEEADANEATIPERVQGLQEKIGRWQALESTAREKLAILQATEQTQLSATDPDSRGMKGNYGHMVGYNVQGAVDAKHHLLAVLEVTNQTCDRGQLAIVAQAAKEALQIEQAELTADGGYFKNEDIQKCQEMGMEPYVPEPSDPKGLYGKKDFTYDPATNSYRCPAGAELKFDRQGQDKGTIRLSYSNPTACGSCAAKAKCTKSDFRTVSRWENDQCIERMKKLMAACPEKLAARKTLIEHPWGTIKYLLSGGFLVCGLPRVQAEVSLVHFAYNLKRAMQVVGMAGLLEAIQR